MRQFRILGESGTACTSQASFNRKKWMNSNHELEEEDLVLILDLKNHLNYPRIGRISKIDTDNAGIERDIFMSLIRMEIGREINL